MEISLFLILWYGIFTASVEKFVTN